jgi:hypothetical protein
MEDTPSHNEHAGSPEERASKRLKMDAVTPDQASALTKNGDGEGNGMEIDGNLPNSANKSKDSEAEPALAASGPSSNDKQRDPRDRGMAPIKAE